MAFRSARIVLRFDSTLVDLKTTRIMEDRKMQNLKSFFKTTQRCLLHVLALICVVVPTTTVFGQGGSDLIWSPRYDGETVAQGKCFFRKKFTLINPDQAMIQIVAQDSFELFINGQSVMTGNSEGKIFETEVSSFLKPGINLVAIRAENYDEEAPGLACKLRVKEMNETRWRSLRTDEAWKTRVTEVTSWNTTGFDDIGWLSARTVVENYLTTDTNGNPVVNSQVMAVAAASPTTAINEDSQTVAPDSGNPLTGAELTETSEKTEEFPKTLLGKQASLQKPPTREKRATLQKPPTREKRATRSKISKKSEEPRFRLDPEFRIQQVMTHAETESVIAMAFDEFGRLIFSQEGGPLMIANLNGTGEERVRELCSQVTSCQGILPLNGEVYVTGDGPSGVGLYRLGANGSSKKLKIKKTLVRFKGEIGEHGPHGIELGNDGMIYCIIGNDSGVARTVSATSPFQNEYPGDLVERYEDPGGHAVGVRGQGGTVIRLSLDGSRIETVAGGIRNAYDLVFDRWGDLFIHDSDMEADMGTSWYRPTAVSHVVAGAELGWRSGWAKFPEYFADTTPPAAKTGRGSPTGAVLYQHVQFPARFHDAIFFADWSEGRILAAFPKEKGATKTIETEIFATGKPLNVTDLAVGQDGSLYFSTGGRGTNGGIYRIFWGGSVPDSVTEYENNLAQIVRQPQPNSAWARQQIAVLQQEMAATWKEDIAGIANEVRNPAIFRTRAMDIMVVYGPFPSYSFLEELSTDDSEEVRAKVAAICGLRAEFQPILQSLLNDVSANVRRHVCESFLRQGTQPEAKDLYAILKSTDRFETVAARRLLERIPVDNWIEDIVTSENPRLFINGALAAVTADPTLDRSYQVLAKASELMQDFISDADFIDLLRVVQLSMVAGNVDPTRVPAFAAQIKSEFPTSNGILNRELARVMAYLKIGGLEDRLQIYLKSSDDSEEDKVHVAMYLQTVGSELDGSERLALIEFLEQAKSRPGGGSYKMYLSNALTDLGGTLTEDQLQTVLENGARWPTVLVPAYYLLPKQMDDSMVKALIDLDEKLAEKDDVERARLGVIALLGRNGDSNSMGYLRHLWKMETDRRSDIAIGLAQQPGGENWPYLVSSLPVLDDKTGVEVMRRLTEVNLRPKTPQFYQEVLQLGYRMEDKGAEQAAQLIRHWAGEYDVEPGNGWKTKLDYWQDWYAGKFPEGPAISTDRLETSAGVYTTAQILDYMDENGPGNSERGHDLFTRVQCASCHRYGSYGDSTGPDLTSLASRFSRREIVEAVVEPSKVVPERYRRKSILTKDGFQFDGMVIQENDSYTVVQNDGEKIVVAEADVEDIKERTESSMPHGLLNDLTLEEINDLFSYMYSSQSTNRVADREATTTTSEAMPSTIRR